jgi:hypothetical protein
VKSFIRESSPPESEPSSGNASTAHAARVRAASGKRKLKLRPTSLAAPAPEIADKEAGNSDGAPPPSVRQSPPPDEVQLQVPSGSKGAESASGSKGAGSASDSEVADSVSDSKVVSPQKGDTDHPGVKHLPPELFPGATSAEGPKISIVPRVVASKRKVPRSSSVPFAPFSSRG